MSVYYDGAGLKDIKNLLFLKNTVEIFLKFLCRFPEKQRIFF